MKVGANCDTKTRSKQFNTFQDYLLRCLWITEAKRGEWSEAYREIQKREILEFELPTAYQKILNSDGWCLSEESYDWSIGKITEVEPEILLKIKHTEITRDNAKVILELQENVGLRTKGESKRRNRNRDKNKSTPKPNGPKDANSISVVIAKKNTRVSVTILFQEIHPINTMFHKLTIE